MSNKKGKKRKKNIALDNNVNQFIKWYKVNMIKGRYTATGEYYFPIKIRNFIEKVAVWYELRYPDCKVNEILFNNNNKMDLGSDNTQTYCCKFNGAAPLMELLSGGEKKYLMDPEYRKNVSCNLNGDCLQLKLSSDGYVQESEFIGHMTPNSSIKELEGKHIKEVVRILKESNVLPKNNEFEIAISNYEKAVHFREEMLNCVMYRIIERGDIIGAKRAFLFAKEFERDIDIPLVYGINSCDPNLKDFINVYIKSGGSQDLVCYINYCKSAKYNKLEEIPLSKLM